MREQKSINKSVFSAVTAFFCAGWYIIQARWLAAVKRKKMSLTDRRPGWRWLAIIPAGSLAALASRNTRHHEKVYFVHLYGWPPRARYIATFTIIGKYLPFFLYILNFSYQAVTLRAVTIFFDYKIFSD